MMDFLVDAFAGYIPFFWRIEQYYFMIFCILFILIFPIYWYIRKLKNTQGRRILLFFKYLGITIFTVILTVILNVWFIAKTSIIHIFPELEIYTHGVMTNDWLYLYDFYEKIEMIEKNFGNTRNMEKTFEKINSIPETKVMIEFLNGDFFQRNSKIIEIIDDLRQQFQEGKVSPQTFNEEFFYSEEHQKIRNLGMKLVNRTSYFKDFLSEKEKEDVIISIECFILSIFDEYKENKNRIVYPDFIEILEFYF